ncbi:MAG TPA: DNA replication/repair protein RecF [Nocardioidaceae bacterium]|nr:DNA replication/repair protein RecF [Nocardioidaceae bacterium]
MHVSRLSLHDFRSYEHVDIEFAPGVSVLVGANGQGKTNLVEAVDYLSNLASHRVATETPLVRHGADQAVVRAVVVRDGRDALLEVELNPGRSNRARVNRAPLPRVRELLGLLRCVVFAPEDLALVKGDPGERRRFLDALLVTRTPRLAGVRSDYDRVLKQRNTLLRSAGAARRGSRGSAELPTLGVWDDHLVRTGAELLSARLDLVDALCAYVADAYASVAAEATSGRTEATLQYRPSVPVPASERDRAALGAALAAELAVRRGEELERGVSLVGPHRDELLLSIGDLPARNYASHGESWSFAFALRLAAYRLLRSEGDDPVLVLDDVFAELDRQRRDHLAALVGDAEQVLVTAAVDADVPASLSGAWYEVAEGKVTRAS